MWRYNGIYLSTLKIKPNEKKKAYNSLQSSYMLKLIYKTYLLDI